jgi:quinol monooxygenase YgiN
MPMPVITEYYARAGHSEQLAELLADHWNVLREEGFTTEQPAFLMRDTQDSDLFIEVFAWKDEDGPDRAWDNPRIAELWNQIQSYCEQEIDPEYFDGLDAAMYVGGG